MKNVTARRDGFGRAATRFSLTRTIGAKRRQSLSLVSVSLSPLVFFFRTLNQRYTVECNSDVTLPRFFSALLTRIIRTRIVCISREREENRDEDAAKRNRDADRGTSDSILSGLAESRLALHRDPHAVSCTYTFSRQHLPFSRYITLFIL